MHRQTRSGRAFSTWDGAHVSPPAGQFDFQHHLREAVIRDDLHAALDDADDAPLNSADAAPPPPTSPMPVQPPTAGASDAAPAQLSGTARKKARMKARSHRNRKQDRREEDAKTFSHHIARDKVKAKYVVPDRTQLAATGLTKAKVARTAYVALDDSIRDSRAYTLEELIGPESEYGFELVKYRKGPLPIISNDPEKYIIAVFADAPDDETWPEVAAAASQSLEEALRRCEAGTGGAPHRRGDFATLRCGVSHGGGQRMPGNLTNRAGDAALAEELNKKEPFRRLAGFATSIMAHWAPKMYDYYVDRLGKLHAHYPALRRNFPSSVFAATTYNLGPHTVCYRHLDFANIPFGWCAVTALGEFDYTTGGHLILWDARLVLEFPPGTTILLPSAVISHSNVAIAPNERRQSFTQYSAGGLFRWVENGFQRTVDFMAPLKDDPEALLRQQADEKGRWQFGLSLLSKLDEIKQRSTKSMQ